MCNRLHDRYLYDNGADPLLRDRFGNRPIDDANREGQADIATFLMNKNASRPLVNSNRNLIALGSKDGKTIRKKDILGYIAQVRNLQGLFLNLLYFFR